MSYNPHNVIESTYNVAKIVALVAAGLWTYFQWDTVLFPQVAEEQQIRNANLQADLSLSLLNLQLQAIGSIETPDTNSTSDPANAELAFLFELSGTLVAKNIKQFPIQLEIKNTFVSVSYGRTDSDLMPVQVLELKHLETLELMPETAFGALASDATILEKDGSATFAFQIPLMVSYELLDQTQKYELSVQILATAIDPSERTILENNSKVKSISVSGFVHGTDATLPREATRIDLGEVLRGNVLGGNNATIPNARTPIGCLDVFGGFNC